MLWNIVDHRSNTHCNEVDVVFESGWHDNSVDGASKTPQTERSIIDWEYKITIQEAIEIASTRWEEPVTVYFYDYGTWPASPSAY